MTLMLRLARASCQKEWREGELKQSFVFVLYTCSFPTNERLCQQHAERAVLLELIGQITCEPAADTTARVALVWCCDVESASGKVRVLSCGLCDVRQPPCCVGLPHRRAAATTTLKLHVVVKLASLLAAMLETALYERAVPSTASGRRRCEVPQKVSFPHIQRCNLGGSAVLKIVPGATSVTFPYRPHLPFIDCRIERKDR